MTLRMTLTWRVLEAAKAAGDQRVIAACRRVINGDKVGRVNPDDYRLVREFSTIC